MTLHCFFATDVLPKPTETTGPDGIITIVEWKLDENDRKVKVTRRVRRRLQTSEVSHTVAERKHWAKFGEDKGKPPGPDRATTTVGENINFKVIAGGQKAEPAEDEAAKAKATVGTKRIMCRFCKGDHYTSKCPLRETLEGAGMGDVMGGEMPPADDGPSGGAGGSKYVPPCVSPQLKRLSCKLTSSGPLSRSMRAGAKGTGESMFRREDMPTIRVTSLSSEADEDDLRSLFGRFGHIARVNVVRDRETGESKGFAFVAFDSKRDAETAAAKMDGHGAFVRLLPAVRVTNSLSFDFICRLRQSHSLGTGTR